MSDENNSFKDLLNGLAQLVAVVMILRYALLIVNHYVTDGFLPTEGTIYLILKYIEVYAPMALMVLVGLSAVWDKGNIAKLVFLIVCAVIVIFTFFPGVMDSITDYIGVKNPKATEETASFIANLKL
jgi:hypothetical protein